MLDQLDPYTEYFPANRNEEIKQMTTGKYAGVGAIIAPRKDLRRCIISTPYEGMPAANVGLRRGDVILSIGGVDTGELDTLAAADYSSKVSNMLRGEPGTSFDIRIRRPGISKELTFKVTRQAIVLPSITCATVISDSIGYILLSGYTETPRATCVRPSSPSNSRAPAGSFSTFAAIPVDLWARPSTSSTSSSRAARRW